MREGGVGGEVLFDSCSLDGGRGLRERVDYFRDFRNCFGMISKVADGEGEGGLPGSSMVGELAAVCVGVEKVNDFE